MMPGAKLAPDVGISDLFLPHYYLPDGVVDEILVRLPIMDAVRTSVLSKKWRFQWQKMSQLVFHQGHLLPLNKGQGLDNEDILPRYKFARIIDIMLSLHLGPIQRFVLSVRSLSSPDVDRWIMILQRNHIKEIMLEFLGSKPYQVPSLLFSCYKLTNLHLCNCELKPSLSFSELPNLEHLFLVNIRDPGGRVEALISCSPSLKLLELKNIQGPNHIELCTPCLSTLIIDSVYFDVIISNAPLIDYLYIYLNYAFDDDHVNQNERIKIPKILNGLLNLDELVITGYSLEWFFRGSQILDRLPATYEHLVELTLALGFEMEEFMALLCLLRSSPNLETLDITVDPWEDISIYSVPEDLNITFLHLQLVRVQDMIGTRQELMLMKCILAGSPALRALKISIDTGVEVTDKCNIFMELMRYPRASTVAEIICKDKLVLPALG